MKFSRKAKKGVEYHEAFHRILELLVDTKTREKAYARYRKKYGENLTDRQIAEKAADEFWWYKKNAPTKMWSWNFKELLNIAKGWYNVFTNVGSFRLMKLYRSATLGKFRNAKINPESIARWKKLTKETKGFLPYTYEYKNNQNILTLTKYF